VDTPQDDFKLRTSTVIGERRKCTGVYANYRKKVRRPSQPIGGDQTRPNGSRQVICLPIVCVCLLNGLLTAFRRFDFRVAAQLVGCHSISFFRAKMLSISQ
jgi:hypothetical protein